MALGRLLDPLDAGVGRRVAPMRRGEQHLIGDVLVEAGAKPRFVGGVLQQAAHQVGHARNHLADGNVLARAQAHFGHCGFQLVRHAVEHLHFERVLREIELLAQGERVSDGAHIVRAQGELDTTLVGPARGRRNESGSHALEARVGLRLAAPDGNGPASLLGDDRLVVPVGALDEAHGHLPASIAGPLDDPASVVVAAAQISLHGQPRREVDRVAALHEELEGQVLLLEELHVEVDEYVVLRRGLEDRPQRHLEAIDRPLEVDRVGAGVERADLDRHVGALDRAEMIRLQALVLRPAAHGLRQVLDQVEIADLIRARLGVADARLAEQVDREGDPPRPQLLELRHRALGVHAGDEALSHRRDLARDGPGHRPLEQPPRLQTQPHPRRRRNSRLAHVVGEVIVHLLGRLEGREGIDEAKELNLERVILHRPVDELLRPERRREQTGAAPPCLVQQLAANLENPLLEDGIARGDGLAQVWRLHRNGGGVPVAAGRF